ncbi:MAG: 4Fe-4S binding protein [Candidatus Hydrothermia bacterium]
MYRNRIVDRLKRVRIIRKFVQVFSTLSINSYIPSWKNFSIYQGPTKKLCAPGLNCYACPFARSSCPIGSLQHFAVIREIPYYVVSYIALVGVLFGRTFCGWLCPFGLLQELIKKVTNFRVKIKKEWGIIKYVILIVLIPIVYFTMEPWFCKLCPAGTIEGTFVLMVSPLWEELSKLISYRFFIKIAIAIILIIVAALIRRPFCRYMCPLGALWGLFNKVSFVRFKVDTGNCARCDLCQEVCPMDIKIYEDPNHFDCIRCLKCVYVCPRQVISVELAAKEIIKPVQVYKSPVIKN